MRQEINIDFENINTQDALQQQLLFEILDFPGFYRMNVNAFRDTITGLVEMPKTLILKNHKMLQNRLPNDYELLIEHLNDVQGKIPHECNQQS
jgi:RNAse (barnase) inhibitor barstar